MRFLLCLLLSAFSVLAGNLTERFNLTAKRVLKDGPPVFDEKFILADADASTGRRFTEFSGDVSGRYIGALAAASRRTGERYPILDRIVAGVAKLQQQDGHFGAPMSTGKVQDSDMATLWGNGRMLIGLLEYYDLTHRPDALATARKLGDFLVRVAPRFNSNEVREAYNGEKFAVGYICWTNSLEGLVELYRVTKAEPYLALSRAIAARTDRHPSQHSHGFLTTVRGVVALYKVTAEKRYLEQAETAWQGVLDSGNVLVQGAVPEMFAPQIKRDEGCSEADWLRLSLNLWDITRQPKYMQQAQITLFNEMSFNQFHTGDFGHHTFSNEGVVAPFAHAWWCCTFHGLRALAAVYQSVFHDQSGALSYDLPVDGPGAIEGLTVRADSSLERNASIQINVLKTDGKAHVLRVRLPEWSSGVKLSLAGQALETELQDGYLSASRIWQAGDVVTATYALQTRLVKRGTDGKQAAVFHGPWLLAVDESASPAYFDEPSNENKVELPEKDGHLQLVPAAVAAGASAHFAVPVAHFQLNYLPGGYSIQRQSALLRPIAEYTAGPDANELNFWLPLVPTTQGLDSNYKQQ